MRSSSLSWLSSRNGSSHAKLEAVRSVWSCMAFLSRASEARGPVRAAARRQQHSSRFFESTLPYQDATASVDPEGSRWTPWRLYHGKQEKDGAAGKPCGRGHDLALRGCGTGTAWRRWRWTLGRRRRPLARRRWRPLGRYGRAIACLFRWPLPASSWTRSRLWLWLRSLLRLRLRLWGWLLLAEAPRALYG